MTENTLTFYAATLDKLKDKILAFQERNLEFIVTRVDYTDDTPGVRPNGFVYTFKPCATVAFSPYIATIENDALRAYLGQRCAWLLHMPYALEDSQCKMKIR